jgi:hypothetical protein
MILLRLGDCFGRNGQVGHEFVEPMLAEDSAAEEVVDPTAGLAEVDAGLRARAVVRRSVRHANQCLLRSRSNGFCGG